MSDIATPDYANPEFVGNFAAILQYHEFWIGALAGIIVLFFDSFRRYDAFERSSAIFLEFGAAPPSLLTSPLVYHQSLIVYYLLRVAAFSVPAIIFPVLLMRDPGFLDPLYSDFLKSDTRFSEDLYGFVTTPIFPLIWAFASAGFVSLLPEILTIEPRIRRFAQSVAFIATSVQRRLVMVHRSDLAPPTEPVGDAAPDAFLREIDQEDIRGEADWHSLERRWARLAQILRMLDPSNRGGVNSRFIEEHSAPFQRLTEDFYGLRVRMRYHRTLTREVDEATATQKLDLLDRLSKHDPELLRDVNKTLGVAEKTLAAALPTSTRLVGRSSQRLRDLGFELQEVEDDMSFGLVFIAIAIGCVAGFFGTLMARGVTQLIATMPGVTYTPTQDPLTEATSIVIYYAAMFAAVALGSLWLGARAAGLRHDVTHPPSYVRRPLGQYFFAGLVGALFSYLAIMLVVVYLAGLETAMSAAGRIAIFAPVFFATNFAVLFPIFGPVRRGGALIGEAAMLSAIVSIVTFISFIFFDNAGNAARVAAGETPIASTEILGRAIFSALRSFVVNIAVFIAVVYMAHQLRAARRLGANAEAPMASAAPATA